MRDSNIFVMRRLPTKGKLCRNIGISRTEFSVCFLAAIWGSEEGWFGTSDLFARARPDLKIWNAPWIRICILCRFRRCGSRSPRLFYTVHDLVLSSVSDANYNIPVPFVRIRKYMRLPIKIRYAPFILSRRGTKELCFDLSRPSHLCSQLV